MLEHRLDHCLVEGSRPTGEPDQGRRAKAADHLQQAGWTTILPPAGHQLGVGGQLLLVPGQARPVGDDQSPRVDAQDASRQVRRRHAGRGERAPHRARTTTSGCARAQEHHALVTEGAARLVKGRVDPGRDHRAGALDVVVERRDALAVTLQDLEGVVVGEVLPLHQRPGKHRAHRLHQLVDQREVLGSPDPPLAHPEVERVVQQVLVVGADVEVDGQAAGGMDAGASRVEGQLADRDPHAADAEIAQAQDRLVVGHHDHPAVLNRGALQYLPHPPAVGRAQIDPARPPVDVAVELAGSPHGRRVDDRRHLLDVPQQQPVEEGLVAVLQRGQEQVALHVLRHVQVVAVDARLLLGRRGHTRRQQAVQTEGVALLLGEARALVQDRVVLQFDPARPDQGVALGSDRIDAFGELHHRTRTRV